MHDQRSKVEHVRRDAAWVRLESVFFRASPPKELLEDDFRIWKAFTTMQILLSFDDVVVSRDHVPDIPLTRLASVWGIDVIVRPISAVVLRSSGMRPIERGM